MDKSTRLKVLARLTTLKTESALASLRLELDSVLAVLASSTDFDELEYALEVLSVIGVVYSDQATRAVADFIRLIEERRLVVSEDEKAFHVASRYRTSSLLLRKALEVITLWRYLQTETVLSSLLWAAIHEDESVRSAATSALKKLTTYNIDVYYGSETEQGRSGGIGAYPQVKVLSSLEKLPTEERRKYFRPLLSVASELLSTEMESASWTSAAVMLSRTTTPAEPAVLNLRERCLTLLAELYREAKSTSEQLAVVNVINAATRAANRSAIDAAYRAMIDANALTVLALYKGFLDGANYQVIQKIEHHSYWIHYHNASDAVRNAALEVKEAIDSNAEYSIYKTLIGFEGVFGEWTGVRDEVFKELKSQDSRMERAREFLAQISAESYSLWKQRILAFAKTESNDLATFPVFYEFLRELAEAHPKFALDLLKTEFDTLSAFLIPLLSGLLSGELKAETQSLMQSWVDGIKSADDTRIYAAAKVYLSVEETDVALMRAILAKAVSLGFKPVIHQLLAVALTRYETSKDKAPLHALFFDGLAELTALNDASWVSNIWFRNEAKAFVATLSAQERRRIFENLLHLNQIDYQAEDVLAAIAEVAPLEVVDFLCERASHEDFSRSLNEMSLDDYEAIPFTLHSLQTSLSKDAESITQRVLQQFRQAPELFQFRGARLLQAVFPEFPEVFSGALVRIIRERQERGLEFVAGVLRAYDGQDFIYPVAKELIKALDSDSPLRTDVEIALQSTGVVIGEFGMAEAYERKRVEVLHWLQDEDERVRDFARSYISDLEGMAKRERARAQEGVVLRKHRYGEE